MKQKELTKTFMMTGVKIFWRFKGGMGIKFNRLTNFVPLDMKECIINFAEDYRYTLSYPRGRYISAV